MIESLSWFRSFSVFEDNVMSSILALTLKVKFLIHSWP